MPVHSWNRVAAGIFRAFHTGWVAEIQNVLNGGLLPKGYYALAEQHVGRNITDVLTLHTSSQSQELPPLPASGGGIAVAEAPPRVRRKQTIRPVEAGRRRTLAIRHVSGHRLIALIEIVSPGNKDRAEHVDDFVAKAVSALGGGVHLLLVDLFPPGQYDPQGMHGVICRQLDESQKPYDLPANEPLTFARYAAGAEVDVYLEHVAVGAALPEMPLFLTPDRYIRTPLEATYEAAFQGMPEFWRNALG